ncbi:MAG: metal-dependent transcriptional regulator [Lentisphaeria bacterium]|nr:metal-dependent transcriptional regulator [Lentisphaeria bacterium]
MAKKLSASLEDYLEAIAELCSKEGHAHSKEIAEKLSVKMPSVTEALRQLVEMGYIIYNTHYPVQLTDAGRAVAEEIVKRHRVLKRFFTEILGLTPAKAADTACHLEHVVDEDTIARFVIFSDAIAERADAKSLQIYLTEAMSHLDDPDSRLFCTLKELAVDESAVIERFSRNLSATAIPALAPGDKVTLTGISLDKTILKITVNGTPQELPIAIAENIWCKR